MRLFDKILLIRLYSPFINKMGPPRNQRPPYVLKYIQALLEQSNYEIELFDGAIDPFSLTELINRSQRLNPQLVVICGTTLEAELVVPYTRALKEFNPNIITVMVGQDVSARPWEYISDDLNIDFAIKGEAELEVIGLIRQLNENKNITGLRKYYKEKLFQPPVIVEKLDELPLPGYSLIELERYNFVYPLKIHAKVRWGHVLSSRGCPYKCIFCSAVIRESYGNKVRLRNPKKVVDEIEIFVSKGVNVIAFDDDNFTTSEEHVKGVCQEIIQRKLKINWICHARIDNLSESLLVLMKQAGCVLLRCGVESGAENILKKLKKGGEPEWVEKTKKVFLIARRIGIPINALFLIGNPSETREDIEKTIELAKELSPDIIQVCFFTPYPGSEAFAQYEHKLNKAQINRGYHYQIPLVNFSQINTPTLKTLERLFYRSILFNPIFILKHIWRYSLFYFYNYQVLFILLKGLMKMA